jgi:hypothetical protein
MSSRKVWPMSRPESAFVLRSAKNFWTMIEFLCVDFSLEFSLEIRILHGRSF